MFGAFNLLKHNRGISNKGQGVVAHPVFGANQTDHGNYANQNAVSPQCVIDGQSVPGTGGKYC